MLIVCSKSYIVDLFKPVYNFAYYIGRSGRSVIKCLKSLYLKNELQNESGCQGARRL